MGGKGRKGEKPQGRGQGGRGETRRGTGPQLQFWKADMSIEEAMAGIG